MIRTHLWGGGGYLWTNRVFTDNLSTAGICLVLVFQFVLNYFLNVFDELMQVKMNFIRENKQMRKS